MTPDGATRVAAYYGPLVREGDALLAAFSDDQLEAMREFLVAAQELTDRQRRAIRG